jgi:hypothetical protein
MRDGECVPRRLVFINVSAIDAGLRAALARMSNPEDSTCAIV